MIDWESCENTSTGYLLKIICIENAKSLVNVAEERVYQLVLLKKGNAIITVNGKTIAIHAPCVICVNDNDQITWRNPLSEYEMNIICFHPSVINRNFDCENINDNKEHAEWTHSDIQDRILLLPFFERKTPYGGCLNVEINTFRMMLQLFNHLQNQMNTEPDGYWPCRGRSYFIELLIILQMRYIDDSRGDEFLELNESQKEIDAVLDYIHSNYSSKITIDLLTKQFNINRNSLNKRFTELTGYTPISYLILHRLKVAESLLVNTQIPVFEICERVGFGELSNFMKSFKKKYGQTPANYRTLYTTMDQQ